MKKLLLSAIACTALFASCSADSTDFKKAAEDAMVKAYKDAGITATASCEKPASTAVGSTFVCTGTGADGATEPWLATITKKDAVTVAQSGVSDVPAEEAPAEEAPVDTEAG